MCFIFFQAAIEQKECRFCLADKNDSISGFYIHLNSSNESSSVFQPFQQILLNLTGIDIFINKDIISWICDQCENKFMDFDRFRKKCCESNDVYVKRAGIKRFLNKNSELSLLERLEALPVKVDLIEEEKDLYENVTELEEKPKESELSNCWNDSLLKI